MRLTYWVENEQAEPKLCSIRAAKKLLKTKGGTAYTCHHERDGTLFEVTPVKPEENNSRFKYNRHL